MNSCAPGADPSTSDAADVPAGETQQTSSGAETESAGDSTPQASIHASRLRLPDMETLPDNSELATGKRETGGGGVIARPPSE